MKLNISESDNSQDLELVREVAPYFRLDDQTVQAILGEVQDVVRGWRAEAQQLGFGRQQIQDMAPAFRLVE